MKQVDYVIVGEDLAKSAWARDKSVLT